MTFFSTHAHINQFSSSLNNATWGRRRDNVQGWFFIVVHIIFILHSWRSTLREITKYPRDGSGIRCGHIQPRGAIPTINSNEGKAINMAHEFQRSPKIVWGRQLARSFQLVHPVRSWWGRVTRNYSGKLRCRHRLAGWKDSWNQLLRPWLCLTLNHLVEYCHLALCLVPLTRTSHHFHSVRLSPDLHCSFYFSFFLLIEFSSQFLLPSSALLPSN